MDLQHRSEINSSLLSLSNEHIRPQCTENRNDAPDENEQEVHTAAFIKKLDQPWHEKQARCEPEPDYFDHRG